jgi:hypothetical protein
MINEIRRTMITKAFITAVTALFMLRSAFAFEGRITAALTRGGQSTPLLYTAGTNCLRVEVTASSLPNPVDLLDLPSGELMLLFPNNRSFVRLKAEVVNPAAVLPSAGLQPSPPAMPQMPAAGGMSALPMMPLPMMEPMELTATGDKTNLLGLVCEKFQIKQRGETMVIWATAQLFPFRPYVQNQPHRFGPQMIEEQWGELLKAKKLFPLLAVLKFENGAEQYRFEIKTIRSEKMSDGDANLFLPPSDYQEIQPLPF